MMYPACHRRMLLSFATGGARAENKPRPVIRCGRRDVRVLLRKIGDHMPRTASIAWYAALGWKRYPRYGVFATLEILNTRDVALER